jgi:hypothetical protein
VPAPAERRRGPLAWAFATVASLALVALVVVWAEPRALVDTLAGARLAPLAVGAGCFVVTCLARWVRLAALVDPPRRPLPLLGVAAGHAFLTLVLPFRLGELSFPVLLARATGAPAAVGVLYLAAIRVTELAILALTVAGAAAAWALGASQLGVGRGALLAAVLAAGALVLVFLRPLLGAGLALVARLARLGPLARRPLGARLADAAAWSRDELARLDRGRLVVLGATTLVAWAGLFGLFHFALRAVGLDPPLALTIVGATGGVLANLLPISALGSLGTLEVGWTAGYAAAGLAVGPVAAAGLLMHGAALAITGAFAAAGALALVRRAAP